MLKRFFYNFRSIKFEISSFIVMVFQETLSLDFYNLRSSGIGQRANLKTGVSGKQSTPNFPEKRTFLTLIAFRKIWRALFSWNTRWDSPFCLITDKMWVCLILHTGWWQQEHHRGNYLHCMYTLDLWGTYTNWGSGGTKNFRAPTNPLTYHGLFLK